MPIHDWSRAEPYQFYDFQASWSVATSRRLNELIEPLGHYALIGNLQAELTDVPSLGFGAEETLFRGQPWFEAATGAFDAGPSEPRRDDELTGKPIGIYDVDGNQLVAVVCLLLGDNKTDLQFERFVVKAAEAIRIGIHLLLIDLHPPTSRDPQGIHGAIAGQMGDRSYLRPADKPLTLVSYVAMPVGRAYVEPVAVGDTLPPMPLFLDEGHYVNVPLEDTYMAAFRGVPRRWKPALEGTTPS